MNQTTETVSQSRAKPLAPKVSTFEKALLWASKKFNLLGMTGFALVTAVTCADIFIRVVHNPIKGVFDIVQLFMGVAIALTVAQTIIDKGNVAVSLVLDLFPKRVQNVVETVTLFFSVILFGAITYGVFLEARGSLKVGEHSETLQVPMVYQKSVIAMGLAVATIVLIVHFVKTFTKAVKK